MEADIGVMPSQAKERQEPSEPGKGKEAFSSRAVRGSVTLPNLDFWLLAFRTVRINSVVFTTKFMVIYYSHCTKLILGLGAPLSLLLQATGTSLPPPSMP